MATYKYYFAYPLEQIWIGPRVTGSELLGTGGWRALMEEVVGTADVDGWGLRVERDGCMVLTPPTDSVMDETNNRNVEADIKRWRDICARLNAFSLLLASESDKTTGEASVPFRYLDHQEIVVTRGANGEDYPAFGLHQTAHALWRQRFGMGSDPKSAVHLLMRVGRSDETVTKAIKAYEALTKDPTALRLLDMLAIAQSDFHSGKHNPSVVLAWFVIESLLNIEWSRWLDSMNGEVGETSGGQRVMRINSDRKQYLTGRDYTASIISQNLELLGILTYDDLTHITEVRQNRNAIAHKAGIEFGMEAPMLALRTAMKLFSREFNADVVPNLSRSWYAP
ncbi:MAG: hypothetical protein KDE31_10000 [Caldilineaceae bacterium]|nr:hypothetical protein [Caldilineaceae bacterium]